MTLESVISAVLVAGILQGTFTGAGLLFHKHHNLLAGRLLALLVIALSVLILAQLLQKIASPGVASFIAFLNINTELTFGPLVFLFLRAVVQPLRNWNVADIMHFLPAAMGLLIWFTAWALIASTSGNIAIPLQAFMPVGLFLSVKIVIFTSYFVAACMLLVKASAVTPSLFAGRNSISVKLILYSVVTLGVFPFCIYLTAILDVMHIELPVESDEFSSMIVVGLIYLGFSMLFFTPWLLSLKSSHTQDQPLTGLQEKLQRLMVEKKPWLDSELTLRDLAQALNSTEAKVSVVIRGLNSSFYDLVNEYRLAEFERLLNDPGSSNSYILNLAFASGFNSKASFYRAFRASYGMTPVNYRKHIQAQ